VSGPTFNEFALRIRGSASAAAQRLREKGIIAGVPLDQPGLALPALPDADKTLLVAVTERHHRADIDRLAHALDEVCP
jgi:glycine dehydrogenase subunit 1